jgi:hypothetical protein
MAPERIPHLAFSAIVIFALLAARAGAQTPLDSSSLSGHDPGTLFFIEDTGSSCFQSLQI